MTPHTAIDNDILEVYHKADSSIWRIVPALFIPTVRPLLLNILVLCILGAYLPSAQAMSDGSFPGKGSKAAWEKAGELNHQGNVLEKAGKDREALSLYQKAIALYPHDSLFYYNMGNAYSDLKERKQAIVWYKKALTFEPGYYSAWYNLCLNLYAEGQYAESNKALKKAEILAKTEKQKERVKFMLNLLKQKLK